MQRIKSPYNKSILVGIIIVGVLFAPILAQAQSEVVDPAESLGCSGVFEVFSKPFTCIVGYFVMGLNYVMGFILGVFLSLATMILGFAISFSGGVLDPEQNAVVFVGWTIVRDIANLGFVLLLIVVAVSTILRQQKYGYKNLLLKLIAAAILVNFSLSIAGIFIDFSNVLTNFFMSKISTNPHEIASAIAGAFGPQRLISGSTPTEGGALDIAAGSLLAFGPALLQIIASLAFSNIFLVLAIFTIIVLAAMLILRYLWISFLLIISPIVWLFWVFPDLSSNFSKWWEKFIRWVFFAPASMFFVYLALFSMENMEGTKQKIDSGSFFINSFGELLSGVLSQGIQMILLVGLMLGGMIVAQKMGVGAAGAALKIAERGGKALLSGVKTYSKERLAGRALDSKIGQKGTGIVQRAGEGLHAVGANSSSKFVRALTKPLRNVGGAIYRGGATLQAKGQETTGELVADSLERERARKDPSYKSGAKSFDSYITGSLKKEFIKKKGKDKDEYKLTDEQISAVKRGETSIIVKRGDKEIPRELLPHEITLIVKGGKRSISVDKDEVEKRIRAIIEETNKSSSTDSAKT